MGLSGMQSRLGQYFPGKVISGITPTGASYEVSFQVGAGCDTAPETPLEGTWPSLRGPVGTPIKMGWFCSGFFTPPGYYYLIGGAQVMRCLDSYNRAWSWNILDWATNADSPSSVVRTSLEMGSRMLYEIWLEPVGEITHPGTGEAIPIPAGFASDTLTITVYQPTPPPPPPSNGGVGVGSIVLGLGVVAGIGAVLYVASKRL